MEIEQGIYKYMINMLQMDESAGSLSTLGMYYTRDASIWAPTDIMIPTNGSTALIYSRLGYSGRLAQSCFFQMQNISNYYNIDMMNTAQGFCAIKNDEKLTLTYVSDEYYESLVTDNVTADKYLQIVEMRPFPDGRCALIVAAQSTDCIYLLDYGTERVFCIPLPEHVELPIANALDGDGDIIRISKSGYISIAGYGSLYTVIPPHMNSLFMAQDAGIYEVG